jgi:alkylation response protein AidB-like acyl-CoA dehydrogenase
VAARTTSRRTSSRNATYICRASLQTKAHLGDAGRDIARMATEAHGGMGFTDLFGLHHWVKRIGFNRQMFGSPEHCRDAAARLQGRIT